MGNISQAFDEIEKRIRYHARAGGILDGFTVETNQTAEITGVQDLPSIRMSPPTLTETRRGGFVVPTSELNIAVATNRLNGVAAHVRAIENVMDAIETNLSGIVDTGLCGSLRAPVQMSSGPHNALDLSLNSDLALKLEHRCSNFGNRRLS